MTEHEQKSKLEYLVPDSGTTHAIHYHQIRDIPPGTISLGDVFIVRNKDHPGVMFMQATEPTDNGHNGWMLEELKLRENNNGN